MTDHLTCHFERGAKSFFDLKVRCVLTEPLPVSGFLTKIASIDILARLVIITPRPREVFAMSTLTFRNSQGALIDVPTVAATRVKNEFGAIL